MDHLSSSQISLYLQCSLKYRFNYLDRLPRPFRPSGLAFGGAVHAALAWLHSQMVQGNGLSLEKLCKIFEADWYAQKLDTEVRYRNGETEMSLVTLARQILGLYFKSPQKDILAAELPFTVPLTNPLTGQTLGPRLEGFMDLVVSDDTIVEFKTSSQAMTSSDLNDTHQLTAYSYAYEVLYRRPAKRLRVVDLVKTRKPRMIVLETTRTPQDHQRFLSLAAQVLHGIQSKVFFPRPSFWCRDCEYAEPCRAWRGK